MKPNDKVMVENLNNKFTLGTVVKIEGMFATIKLCSGKTIKTYLNCARQIPERQPKFVVGADIPGVARVRSVQWNGNDYEYEFMDYVTSNIFWREESQL